MGMGTGTTAWAGGLDIDGPGARGACGSSGGWGVSCCACTRGASSNAIEVTIMIRFIGGEPANLNSVSENQDSDADLQLASIDTASCLRVQIRDIQGVTASQAVVPYFKCRPDREATLEPFLLRIFRKRRRERRENVSRNQR